MNTSLSCAPNGEIQVGCDGMQRAVITQEYRLETARTCRDNLCEQIMNLGGNAVNPVLLIGRGFFYATGNYILLHKKRSARLRTAAAGNDAAEGPRRKTEEGKRAAV